MTDVIHFTNPLTGKSNGVTHKGASIHVYPDGTLDIDTGDMVFALNSKTSAKQIAKWHSALLNAPATE